MSEMVVPPDVPLLHKIVLAILGFAFLYEVEYCSFKVSENLFWIFVGIALNL